MGANLQSNEIYFSSFEAVEGTRVNIPEKSAEKKKSAFDLLAFLMAIMSAIIVTMLNEAKVDRQAIDIWAIFASIQTLLSKLPNPLDVMAGELLLTVEMKKFQQQKESLQVQSLDRLITELRRILDELLSMLQSVIDSGLGKKVSPDDKQNSRLQSFGQGDEGVDSLLALA